jgi:Family of unknown function (DUF6535)
VISLTCALLATLLQQWARRYVTITQPPRYSHGPHKRAPIRAFFANGVEKFHLPWSVEALPTLLHLSLFLFFIGLAIYLFNINQTVFSVVVWWVVLAGGVYGCITLMPIFWHDSPYYAPLSSSAWLLYVGTAYAISNVASFLRDLGFPFIPYLPRYIYEERFHEGMTTTVQETGSILSVEMNSRILTWTIEALEEDKELEQFFEAIPGFRGSNVVDDFQLIFDKVDWKFFWAFHRFLSRTLTSSLILGEDKKRRVIISAKAIDAGHLSHTTVSTLASVFSYGVDLLRSVDIWHSLRSTSAGQVPGLCSQVIIAGVVASVSERDDRWEALAKDRLGVSETVFQNYLANGDSVLLANFIDITRPLFRLCFEDEYKAYLLTHVLPCISKFDIQNTLPGLQHGFCDLWNEITREACNRGSYRIPSSFLRLIRHFYIALHQGTDAAPTSFDASTDDEDLVLYDPSSYPLCNIPGHHSDSSTGETTHSLTTASPADPPDAFLNPSIEPAVLSFPSMTEGHGRIHFVGESSLRDATLTFESSPRVNVETSHPAATSLDLITQGPTDMTPTISLTPNSEPDPHPAPAVSMFTPDPSFAPSRRNISDLHNIADIGIVPNMPLSSLSSSGPAFSDTLPASSLAPSPEFQIGQVTAAPGPLPPSTFATSTSLTQPQGTSIPHLRTTLDDGTFDNDHRPRALTPTDVAVEIEQLHESAMSVSGITTDLSLDSSGAIDRPE